MPSIDILWVRPRPVAEVSLVSPKNPQPEDLQAPSTTQVDELSLHRLSVIWVIDWHYMQAMLCQEA